MTTIGLRGLIDRAKYHSLVEANLNDTESEVLCLRMSSLYRRSLGVAYIKRILKKKNPILKKKTAMGVKLICLGNSKGMHQLKSLNIFNFRLRNRTNVLLPECEHIKKLNKRLIIDDDDIKEKESKTKTRTLTCLVVCSKCILCAKCCIVCSNCCCKVC